MSKDYDYRGGVTESEDHNNLDEEEYDEFESVGDDVERKYQCRQCLTFFSNNSDFKKHIEFHEDNYAFEFIRDCQPVDGAILLSKFKKFDLVELEKAGKIKFSDEHMAWALSDYEFKKTNDKKPIKIKSISNSPCIDCIYEKDCSIDNENKIANPNHCELISNWADGRAKNRQKRIKKTKGNAFDNIDVALFWFGRSRRFDFIGTLEQKNVDRPSASEFNVVDEVSKSIPINIDYDDRHKFKSGDKVKISDVRLSGKGNRLTMVANRQLGKHKNTNKTKIQKI